MWVSTIDAIADTIVVVVVVVNLGSARDGHGEAQWGDDFVVIQEIHTPPQLILWSQVGTFQTEVESRESTLKITCRQLHVFVMLAMSLKKCNQSYAN